MNYPGHVLCKFKLNSPTCLNRHLSNDIRSDLRRDNRGDDDGIRVATHVAPRAQADTAVTKNFTEISCLGDYNEYCKFASTYTSYLRYCTSL